MRDLINIKEKDKAKISKGFFPTFPSFLSIIIVIIIIRSTIDKILETEFDGEKTEYTLKQVISFLQSGLCFGWKKPKF